MSETKITSRQTNMQKVMVQNLLKNGNFINNSTNGYGSTPDDWTSSSANPVQGGRPAFTKADFLNAVGVATADLEGLWLLNEATGTADATDLSDNGYDLTATNTPTVDSDGLIGDARKFASASSQYATNAAANCRIAGDQTFFAYIKPTTDHTGRFMGVADSTPTNYASMYIANSLFKFDVTGLTPSGIASDVTLEAGKWYFVCGIWDASNTTLKLHVNGVKKTTTGVSGSHTAGTGGFSVGRLGDWASQYFNGVVQAAGVINGALSDDQVNRLWAFLGYQGQKIRRSSTDALLSQNLDQSDVVRLQGQTVTLRADVYAESTNHRIYINDGTTTTASSPTAADAWETVTVTADIGSDATDITVGLEADTTDGEMWVKNVALYESDTDLGYAHSPDDWHRFPNLLKMNIPIFNKGKPYEYEEGKVYRWTPDWTGFSSDPNPNDMTYMWRDEMCWINVDTNAGTSNAAGFSFGLPIYGASIFFNSYSNVPCLIQDSGTWQSTMGVLALDDGNQSDLAVGKSPVSNQAGGGFTASGNKAAKGRFFYRIRY